MAKRAGTMVVEIVVNPDRFFRERVEEPGFLGPALVVFLAAISSVSGTLVTIVHIGSAMPKDLSVLVSFGFGLGAISGFFAVFLTWIAISGSFYLVSSRFDGTGSFRRTVLLTGWGFVPSIFSGLVIAVATYYTFYGVTFPESVAKLKPFMQQMRSSPTFRVSRLLGVVFTVWQGFLWTFAIKYAREIGLREAAITVGIPIVLSVGWKVYQFL